MYGSTIGTGRENVKTNEKFPLKHSKNRKFQKPVSALGKNNPERTNRKTTNQQECY